VRVVSEALSYNHQHGSLWLPFDNPGSSPVALAEVPARNRSLPALQQTAMQGALQAALEGVTDNAPGVGEHAEPTEALKPAPPAPLRSLPGVKVDALLQGTHAPTRSHAHL
jgi:hypothetical protein